MGELFLAEGTIKDSIVVVKQLAPALSADPDYLNMFKDEVRLASLFTHPNLVKSLAADTERKVPYLVLEYIHGADLRRLFTRVRELSLDARVDIAIRIASALHFAHELKSSETGSPLNVVHRDVSLPNILISAAGAVKLIDFGIAKANERKAHTQAGRIKGKVSYLSPEQCFGASLDRRSDIFSLGIVIHELLTGVRLFDGRAQRETMDRITSGDIPRVDAVDPHIDLELADTVARALQVRPRERFQSAEELKEALERWSYQRTSRNPTPAEERSAWVRAYLERAGRAIKTPLPDLLILPTAPPPPLPEERDSSPPPPDPVVLPFEGGPFVGRRAELNALLRLILKRKHRVVTLHGPGGTGKTRLAQRFAELSSEIFLREGGMFYVDAAGTTGLEGFLHATRTALGKRFSASETGAGEIDQLGVSLASLGRALVILDNLDAVVRWVEAPLRRIRELAPEVSFLITSRALIGLAEEVAVDVGPLSLPTSADDLERSEAGRLLIERVRVHRPTYDPTDNERIAATRVLRQLEGIPLAVSLFAERFGAGGAETIAALETRLSAEAQDVGGKSLRHVILRSTIEWSWTLLSDEEQEGLAACSVFAGSFTGAAAAGVMDLGDQARSDLLLGALMKKSMLRGVVDEAGNRRYLAYETIREHAELELDRSGHRQEVEARYERWFITAGEVWAREAWRTGDTAVIEREYQEIFAVLERAKHRPPSSESSAIAAQALLVLAPVLSTRGPFEAFSIWLSELMTGAHGAILEREHPLLLGRLIEATASASPWLPGAFLQADLRKALAAAEQAKDFDLASRVQLLLGDYDRRAGDATAALDRTKMVLAATQRLGLERTEAWAEMQLGAIAADAADLHAAKDSYLRAADIFRRQQNPRAESMALGNLGIVYMDNAQFEDARGILQRAVSLASQPLDDDLLGISLGLLGFLEHLLGRAEGAVLRLGEAIECLSHAGARNYLALYLGLRGAVIASLDFVERAESAFAESEVILSELGPLAAAFASAVRVQRGNLELAYARRAAAEGRPEEAAQWVASARQRLRAVMEASDEDKSKPGGLSGPQGQAVRFACYSLRRALAELPRTP